MENENYQYQDSSIILADNQMNHKQFGSALQQMDNCLEYFQRYYIEQPSFKKKEIEVNFLLMWGQLQFSRSFCHYSLSDLPQAEFFIQSALRINFSADFLLLYAAILHKQQNYARLHQITQILLLCPCSTLSNTTVAPLKCINLLSGLFLNRFQHEDAQFLADLLSQNQQSDYSLLCTFSLIKFFEALEQRLLEPPLPLLQSVQSIFELKTKNLAQILSQLFVLFTKFEGTNEIYQKLNQFEWLLFNQLKISTELKTTKYLVLQNLKPEIFKQLRIVNLKSNLSQKQVREAKQFYVPADAYFTYQQKLVKTHLPFLTNVNLDDIFHFIYVKNQFEQTQQPTSGPVIYRDFNFLQHGKEQKAGTYKQEPLDTHKLYIVEKHGQPLNKTKQFIKDKKIEEEIILVDEQRPILPKCKYNDVLWYLDGKQTKEKTISTSRMGKLGSKLAINRTRNAISALSNLSGQFNKSNENFEQPQTVGDSQAQVKPKPRPNTVEPINFEHKILDNFIDDAPIDLDISKQKYMLREPQDYFPRMNSQLIEQNTFQLFEKKDKMQHQKELDDLQEQLKQIDLEIYKIKYIVKKTSSVELTKLNINRQDLIKKIESIQDAPSELETVMVNRIQEDNYLSKQSYTGLKEQLLQFQIQKQVDPGTASFCGSKHDFFPSNVTKKLQLYKQEPFSNLDMVENPELTSLSKIDPESGLQSEFRTRPSTELENKPDQTPRSKAKSNQKSTQKVFAVNFAKDLEALRNKNEMIFKYVGRDKLQSKETIGQPVPHSTDCQRYFRAPRRSAVFNVE
ncbi:Hypothetical_protein [Hexamita inflata]|uniref:Hypothetical_protein n=1 Tax=Hexamita inflata TaxID=28002 RepID=A0AA86NKA4_9EUKA|nr:Hypothetical protein HINF_LOCUS8377 [Hexamita inflata]